MNGVLVINKPSGVTSRDVVNDICKIFNTRKVGHTGTLDPIAEGVLVVCIGKATKLVEILTCDDKQYVATVKLGVLTDTLDTQGNIIKKEKTILNKEDLVRVLNSFVKEYEQEVPIYSAVRVNGRKLYEYARNNEVINLPKRKVIIKNIELLELNDNEYKFKVSVSKGTYIRSLIKDINDELGIIGVMSNLIRTKQGKFGIENSYKIEDIKNNNYKMLSIEDILKDENCINVDKDLFKIIKNGGVINNLYNMDYVTFIYDDKVVAIYEKYDKDIMKMKPFKMFI